MTNEYRAEAFLRRVIVTMSVRIDSLFLFEVSNSLFLNSCNPRERKAPQEKKRACQYTNDPYANFPKPVQERHRPSKATHEKSLRILQAASPSSLQDRTSANSLTLDSVVVTPATLLVDPFSSLHVLALLLKSDRIASLVPHGTAASVSESLQALLVLGALEDLFHFQVRDGTKDCLWVDELLLCEQVAQRRRCDPGRSAEATSSLVFLVVLILTVGHDFWKSNVVAVGVHRRGLGRLGHGFGVGNSSRCLELARGAILTALVGLRLLVVLSSRWVGVLGKWNTCTTMLHGLAGMGRSLSMLQLMLVVHSGLEYAACVVRSRWRSV